MVFDWTDLVDRADLADLAALFAAAFSGSKGLAGAGLPIKASAPLAVPDKWFLGFFEFLEFLDSGFRGLS